MEQAWNVKRDKVTNESNNIINAYNKKIQALQDDVKKAQQEYDTVRSHCDTAQYAHSSFTFHDRRWPKLKPRCRRRTMIVQLP